MAEATAAGSSSCRSSFGSAAVITAWAAVAIIVAATIVPAADFNEQWRPGSYDPGYHFWETKSSTFCKLNAMKLLAVFGIIS